MLLSSVPQLERIDAFGVICVEGGEEESMEGQRANAQSTLRSEVNPLANPDPITQARYRLQQGHHRVHRQYVCTYYWRYSTSALILF